ncbi:uncharacterized protein LOC110264740 [Arachis ipaensis]|uniref:uncharacterized protein LOC110264740 n=1 Tax=Arachis ipaensis TaxID=130454 RepID=UPI000A2B1691|nr:uncharacterized protein LOC110264740 [Arachis ipaensis]XP_025668060.1 uncharacterized protein LOC112766384 [Arachis hypogaea]QHN94124.1 uncharacterized protein DS421_17g598580 [Arachis hypogaea]
MKTKSKSLDHDAMMSDTFKYTHTLKEKNERFAYQRVVDHYESYTQRLKVATQQSQCTGDDDNNSAASFVDPDMVWCEVASESYKNRVYGLGSFFTDNLRTSTLRQSSASATSRPFDPRTMSI